MVLCGTFCNFIEFERGSSVLDTVLSYGNGYLARASFIEHSLSNYKLQPVEKQ